MALVSGLGSVFAGAIRRDIGAAYAAERRKSRMRFDESRV
jgi:hypothetical protein